MDMEKMRMAIMDQEQTFRQQVHELHRVYHVQKQMMRQMQIIQTTNSKFHQSPAIAAAAAVETKPRFEISFSDKAISHHQFQLLSNIKNSTSFAEEEEEQEQECDLELTLATGRISNSSTRSDKGKMTAMNSSNSDSGTTAVSSTSTDSELKESDVTTTTARFQSEISKKRLVAGEVNCQPLWFNNQCLSLRMA